MAHWIPFSPDNVAPPDYSTFTWVVLLDPEHGNRVVSVGKAFEEVWGLPCEALYRDPWVAMRQVPLEDRAAMVSAFVAAAGGLETAVAHSVTRPDGATLRLRTTYVPVRDHAGRVSRVGGVTEVLDDA